MNNKNLMIVGGVLAVVGVAYYMNTKKKKATVEVPVRDLTKPYMPQVAYTPIQQSAPVVPFIPKEYTLQELSDMMRLEEAKYQSQYFKTHGRYPPEIDFRKPVKELFKA